VIGRPWWITGDREPGARLSRARGLPGDRRAHDAVVYHAGATTQTQRTTPAGSPPVRRIHTHFDEHDPQGTVQSVLRATAK
jgi:hypothetical protein